MRRFPSSDEVEVAVHDLGGEGPPLLLVHATGFCGGVFVPLSEELAASFHCWAVDLRGHGLSPAPPHLDGLWRGFGDDVLAAVDGLGLDGALAVGHSSGGAALLLGEAARPGTFAGLWCYEPIVWPDPDRARQRADRLAEGALRRRDRFPSQEEAYANFSSKPPFASLSRHSLKAYVAHGFAGDDSDGSVVLRCRPEVESAIYRQAVEDDRFALLDAVRCPVVVACGGTTDAITPELGQRLVDALPAARLRVFDALGHFGPLEDPPTVASAILDDLAPSPTAPSPNW